MPIVTLTTDFGNNDYYVAVLKGAMLSQNPTLNIVDVSHNVDTFDIVQAAFILKNAYAAFPTGTIHLVSVNNAPIAGKVFLAIRYKEHYFVGPDNGLFALMFGEISDDIYEIEYDKDNPFPLKDIFAAAVHHITGGLPFNEIGIPIEKIEERISLQPVISPTQIRGAVIHIDNFENVILNIDRELFHRVWNMRNFELYYKRNNPITRLCQHYADVPIGDPLCLFNCADYLEIAIHMGRAASLLGLKVGDAVQIDFHS